MSSYEYASSSLESLGSGVYGAIAGLTRAEANATAASNSYLDLGSAGSYSYSSYDYGQSSSAADAAANILSSSYSSGNTANQVAADLLSLSGAGSLGLGAASVANNDRRVLAYGLSEAEAAILRSARPPQFAASEEISVNGQRGLWTNRDEVLNWRGPISINSYQINQDINPEIIRKQTDQQLTYVQDVSVRYLRPPTPPPPGDIVIQQLPNTNIPPAPPVVIRQVPPRPITPPPLVVREAPPLPPARVDRKLITIPGKVIPPPPRKVVVERLAPLPNKPQNIFIERWLPYNDVKRRVIFQRNNQIDPIVPRPRNVIIQWEAPRVQVRREIRNLGVFRANPAEYIQRYGATLRTASQIPAIAASIRPAQGLVLAAEHRYNPIHELYGDVQALNLINLEREGLGAYRGYLSRYSGVNQGLGYEGLGYQGYNYANLYSGYSGLGSNQSIVDEIFATIDRDSNGRVSVDEAQRILLQLNSRLGRSYGEDDLRSFFAQLDVNGDGFIDYNEFRRAFDNLYLF